MNNSSSIEAVVNWVWCAELTLELVSGVRSYSLSGVWCAELTLDLVCGVNCGSPQSHRCKGGASSVAASVSCQSQPGEPLQLLPSWFLASWFDQVKLEFANVNLQDIKFETCGGGKSATSKGSRTRIFCSPMLLG